MRIEEIPASPKKPKVTRVAAYARVSSDKDAAFHSLEAQTEYYQNYIAAHPDWELVAIYSDNGISGTTIHRPEFQRMLQDCREGKIDLIVTKSVTRFARNTVILLETIRELKKLGVDCYFEKEDMHSISPDGELLLTLLAMYAEEEARSASENQKWRIQKLYDQGKPAGGHTFGYRLMGERFEVVPEEAEIVKEIFRLYLSGMGYSKIARTLIEQHIPAYFGGTWSVASVRNILLNEKYAGDLLLQKTFSEDFRTKKKRKNTGELRKVYVKNSHEAIIDRQTFEAVQQEITRRSARQREIMAHRNPNHDNSQKLFSGLIVCGCCGAVYVRKYTNIKNSDRPIWICGQYTKYGKSVCHSQQIPETILIEKVKEVLGLPEINQTIVQEHISRITVPEHNHLIFELKNGSSVDVFWKHPSRRLSWTDEMREAARQKALMRYRKEEKS